MVCLARWLGRVAVCVCVCVKWRVCVGFILGGPSHMLYIV
jgi:hypothetical protein